MFPGFRNLCDSRQNKGRTGTKKTKCGSWTAQFFCLSSMDQQRVPTSSEKDILYKAGLGLKKVKLSFLFDEEEVMNTLQKEEVFPKLSKCGGFELLRTEQNCRNFIPIPGPWTSKGLQTNVGSQARIYLRPIQHSLSTEPITKVSEPGMKMACEKCNVQYLVQELRDHIQNCNSSKNDADHSDLSTYSNILTQEQNEVQSISSSQYYLVSVASENETLFPLNSSTIQNSHVEYPQDTVDLVSVASENETLYPLNSSTIQNSHVEYPQDTVDQETEMLVSSNVQPYVDMQQDSDHLSEYIPVDMPAVINACIKFCRDNDISNPVEMLRKIQGDIVMGRPLEVEDLETSIEGETSYITVDRNNLLETSMEEIKSIPDEDLRKTLEVQFYNEQAVDYGGPRKEFFRLVLMEIKLKYFDNGLRELLTPEYRTVGIILALSILQNGPMPTFLSPEMVGMVFSTVEHSQAVQKLREGLNLLGLYDLFIGLPELKYLLQPTSVNLTMKRVVTMLKPVFSEEGSNANRYEKEVYSAFIKYLREVAAGRRCNLTLADILQFVTSANEEPLLGFRISPSIQFTEVCNGYLPTASTCVNSLKLPRPNQSNHLPKAVDLFKVYDYAFSNTFYGLQ